MLAFKRKIPGHTRNKSLQQPSGGKWRRKIEKAMFLKFKLAWKSSTGCTNSNMWEKNSGERVMSMSGSMFSIERDRRKGKVPLPKVRKSTTWVLCAVFNGFALFSF